MPNGTCTIEGCGRTHYGRGWCPMHYARWRRHGDPLVEINIMGDDERRFWSKVDKAGPIAANEPHLGPCWLWTGSTGDTGYGTFAVAGFSVRAHKWAWEQEHGPVPDGLELDHFACDRRDCVNPAHVRPVTHLENMARGAHARKTHCPQGHPYDESNTSVYNGRRNCKTCKADRQRAYRANLAPLR